MDSLLITIILASYFGVLILISSITAKGANNQSFFLGNRRSPWYVVAFGMIGATLSGVTFISVPGWVISSQFAYMQMVIGYLAGYQVIIYFLLPLYYRLGVTSIYTYLQQRFGFWSYRSGSFFFILSRTIGASARLFIVASVLQLTIFDSIGVPFWVSVLVTITLIWLYTFRGGIKTIIWTDLLQTFFMLLAMGLTLYFIFKNLSLSGRGVWEEIQSRHLGQIFFFRDFVTNRLHFVKYFFGGMFITIAMTGLDQDMMQKNLSCKSLKEAQKNMNWFSLLLVPVNFLFLLLGAMLLIYASKQGIALPASSDDLFPFIVTQGYLPGIVMVAFMIGLIAAAFSSADSALTALTTSISVDLLGKVDSGEQQLRRVRYRVHLVLSLVILAFILLFRALNDRSIIDTLFTIAGYTYGPLLGLFGFGLLTKFKINDRLVPVIVVIAPLCTYLIQYFSPLFLGGYVFGFELLLLNGLLTFGFLWLIKKAG